MKSTSPSSRFLRFTAAVFSAPDCLAALSKNSSTHSREIRQSFRRPLPTDVVIAAALSFPEAMSRSTVSRETLSSSPTSFTVSHVRESPADCAQSAARWCSILSRTSIEFDRRDDALFVAITKVANRLEASLPQDTAPLRLKHCQHDSNQDVP